MKFLFGVHMHQPVDNFKFAVDKAVQESYIPFFETVSKFSWFKFAFHCSGWLFETIKKQYKTLFEIIKELYDRDQIEFFSGGYYEPILASIPPKDRIGQINKLSSFINSNFLIKPKGVWIAERVWDESIINELAKIGIEYTALDDHHFFVSGIENIEGYYMTEYGGNTIAVFPIFKKLRYALPFFEPRRAIEAIRQYDVAIVFDDLEKFGLWPGTHKWVYNEGWLEKFLEELSGEDIETVHFNEFLSLNKPLGLAYFDNVSYPEMGKWSMQTKQAEKYDLAKDLLNQSGLDANFLRDGLWKNFFVKYEESNRLHKRMLELSKNSLIRPKYTDNLYKLQTNDVYWHGVFGGLYLPNLRDNAYRYLIECENLRYKSDAVEVDDINLDGFDEVKCVKKDVIFRFDSKCGGQLVEFDDRRVKFNFQNTLTRRKESYHANLEFADEKDFDGKVDTIHSAKVKVGDNFKKELVYDWYLKNSFVDHITDDDFNIDNFYRCSFREYSDFSNTPFELLESDKAVKFERLGGIYEDDLNYNTRLTKIYIPKDNGFDFTINLETASKSKYNYVLEVNLHFAKPEDVKINDSVFNGLYEENALKVVHIEDKYTNRILRIRLNEFFKLFVVPTKTISRSETGFELTTQGLSFALEVPFSRSLNIEGEFVIEPCQK